VSGVSVVILGGTAPAMPGMAGRMHAPVASTTARAYRTSSFARISKPCDTACTACTVVAVLTGLKCHGRHGWTGGT
jgi:hypothetical protein